MPPFIVDNSMLRSSFTCTMQAWTRYGQHLTSQDQRAELLSGSAGHAALETYHKTHAIQPALEAFDALYRDWGSANVEPDERLAYHNVRAILEQFLLKHHSGAEPWRYVPDVNYIEVPFEVALDDHGDFLFIGRIDLVGTYNGHYVVNENKFTGWIDEEWKRGFRLDSQLSGYFYGCKYGKVNGQVLNLPIMGGFVTAIQLSKLPQALDRKCYGKNGHGVKYSECRLQHAKWEIFGPIPREEQVIHNWRMDALEGAKRLKRVFEDAPLLAQAGSIMQEGVFTRACRWCEFKKVCETGRDPKGMLGKLIVSKWDPRGRSKG